VHTTRAVPSGTPPATVIHRLLLLLGRLPARARRLFEGYPRLATRTGIGIAEGAGGALLGKTLGGIAGPWEGELPRAATQMLLELERELSPIFGDGLRVRRRRLRAGG
jgi:hypothetical protein